MIQTKVVHASHQVMWSDTTHLESCTSLKSSQQFREGGHAKTSRYLRRYDETNRLIDWTDWLPQRSTVLLKKLTVTQLVKKSLAFHGNRKVIAVLRRARHWSLSWVRRLQSTPSHLISPRYILTLYFHPRLGLQSSIFLSGFPTKILYAFLTSYACYMVAHLIHLDFITLLTFGEAYKLCSSSLLSLLQPPQHPVLIDPQSMFFP
jgi:hypothetical protein